MVTLEQLFHSLTVGLTVDMMTDETTNLSIDVVLRTMMELPFRLLIEKNAKLNSVTYTFTVAFRRC